MKLTYLLLACIVIVLAVACSSNQLDQPVATKLPAFEVTIAPEMTQPVIEITSQGIGGGVISASATLSPITTMPAAGGSGSGLSSGLHIPSDGITLSQNGGSFSMRVGESFLLNLGMDVYDWNVEVNNQNVIQMMWGVMVIRGAQGIYVGQNPGTAILTASGNPFCLQSKPPCMIPSLLFRVTIIVQ